MASMAVCVKVRARLARAAEIHHQYTDD